MSVSHLSTSEIEENVQRLLAEIAARKHAGDCVLIRTEMRDADGRRLELFDFEPVSRCSVSSTAPASALAEYGG